MEPQTTKDKIIEAALNLFAEKGYSAVSVVQIAEAVGIKAPSLYKHYKSKQDIFNAILTKMASRYEEQTSSMQMDGTEPHKDMELFLHIEEEQLIHMGKELFSYFLHDKYAGPFRRMLALEQYHNKELAALYTKQYVDEPLSYQGTVFYLMMQRGAFITENPNVMALHFFSPMFLLLTLCDCNPEREAWALQMVEEHIRQFCRLYHKEK